MADPSTPTGTSGARAALELGRICDEFEAAWRAGARPALEAYLQRVGEGERPTLFRGLLPLELDGLADCGEPAVEEDYLRRFPQWEAVVRQVFRDAALLPPGALAPTVPSAGLGRSPGTGALRREPLPALAGYEVLGVLGRGGMGVVYRARHLGLERTVALKMVRAPHAAGGEALGRFLAEARAVARLQHPGVVQIFEVGEHEGLPYFSLELVGGGTLAGRLAGTPQEPRPAAETVEMIARAVQHAHEHGVVHRDLKPANVLLAEPASGEEALEGTRTRSSLGSPKVSDFGLAKLLEDESGQTQHGQVLGTPSYMAPEQARGSKDVGPACDVYALGAILYEMLTGRPPFRGPSVQETLVQVLHSDAVPPSRLQPRVPRDLETVCLKCLEKDPSRRYPSAAALAEDLRRYLDGRPVLARPVGRPERAWRWCRRNPRDAALVAAGLLALVLGPWAYLGVAGARRAAEADRRDRQARATTAAERSLAKAQLLWNQAKAAPVGDLRLWEQALAAAREAQVVIDSSAVEETTRRRVEETLAGITEARRAAESRAAVVAEDERMKAALERLALSQQQLTTARGLGYVWPFLGNGQYEKLFRSYHGIDLRRPDEAEACIRSSAIRPQLVAALDAWIPLRPDWQSRRQLAELANRLSEPDEARRQLREALATGDQGRLRQLARRDLTALPPRALFDVALALSNGRAFNEAVAVLRPAQQRHPADFGITFHLGYCLGELSPPRLEEQTRFYTAAVALQPANSLAHNSLGNALSQQGRWEEAHAEYRTAHRLDPRNANAVANLGRILYQQGRLDEAIARYQDAVRLEPRDPITHNNLGSILRELGRLDESAAEYRTAVGLDPRYALGHYGLGWALLQRGDFPGARAALQRAGQLLPRTDPQVAVWERAAKGAERMGLLAAQLDAVAQRKKQPANAGEILEYATAGLYSRHSTAARLFKDAFTALPRLAEGSRFEAARAAVRAGWRAQALDWLRADLAARARQAASASAADRQAAARQLRLWQLHVDLAPVRDAAALKGLPEDERALWRELWGEVDRQLGRAEGR